jgi:hypothetical protein
LASGDLIAAYAARPQATVMSGALTTAAGAGGTSVPAFSFESDLLADAVRAIAGPGQATSVLVPFRILKACTKR